MKVRFLMLAERDAGGRLSGVIFQEGQFRPGCFSGTSELLTIMEELVPPRRSASEGAGLAGLGAGPAPVNEPVGE